ncbi:MAG: alpha/beta hydrolase [Gammaproteobacteria bacterium]|nr:MAG: alpha/beta hydrolase [Gammaproteobacteria bacterium]
MYNFDHISGQTFQIDDAKIYCEIIGNLDAPPLLMLHGGLGNIEDFNDIVPDLARDFKVIGIDSRGQGKSTLGTQKLTYERIEKDVAGVLKKLSIRSLNILGFSDGGIAAYRLAATNQLQINRLVTIGSKWQLKNDDPNISIFKKITAKSWREKFPETYDAYMRQNPNPDFDRLVPAIVNMWLDQTETGYPGGKVENISCPLLLIRGDDDHLVALQSIVDLRGIVKNAKFMNVAFAGHVAFEEQKNIVVSTIKQFITQPL